MRPQPPLPRPRRPGVILLVVITLLTLFAVVGITFVIYAQAEASSARICREAETLQRPDMDPELLLSYFLGQFLYDTDNPKSALRGHSLARTMYGKPGNTTAYNGTGRLHTAAPDEYYLVNYAQFGGAAPNLDSAGSPNPPYTYADVNTMLLAAVRASDGAVLAPSGHRPGDVGNGANPYFGSLAPSNPNWNNKDARRKTLRPLPADHSGFPAPEDAGGDVKNLADSPGSIIPGTNPPQFANNDSVWIDLDFPVMKGPDGRRFKPLFAPLVQDLDNRLNVNVHGMIRGSGVFRGNFASHQGWGPWEVNLSRVLTANAEAKNILLGNGTVPGRYDSDANYWGNSNFRLRDQLTPAGPHYAMTDYDGWNGTIAGYQLRVPGNNWAGTYTWPMHDLPFHNGWGALALASGDFEGRSHPRLYNYFSPEQNTYSTLGVTAQKDRRFAASNMEALLRFGDCGSPALTSNLFLLCPQSFQSAKTRRLVTTHSFDLSRPGTTPVVWDPTAQPYALTGAYPTGDVPAAPAAGQAPPAKSEFNVDYGSLAAAMARIDLNRTLPDYPTPDATTHRIRDEDQATFQAAQSARQQLAKEIFDVLRQLTGAADPAAKDVQQVDALRWLAQLAVNIVDYVDRDDFSTPFNWSGKEWVFGTELPRLLLNEVYADASYNNGLVAANVQDVLRVRFWVELLNPRFNLAKLNGTLINKSVPEVENGDARLQVPAAGSKPAYACYRVIITESADTNLTQPSNTLGEPDPKKIKLVVSDFTSEPKATPALAGDELFLVHPINDQTTGPAGKNQGFYVLGPIDDFPGTNPPVATLRVQDQKINDNRSALVYEAAARTDVATLNHNILLQRLACPYRPPQPDAAQPDYNPYVTIDYLDGLATNNNVNGINAKAVVLTDLASVGRKQPFAAHGSQVVAQAATPAGQPKNTLFAMNDPKPAAFDWLAFRDRPLISPAELLHVSGYKPHELTQKFYVEDTKAGTVTKNGHQAPWLDAKTRLHRFFEFVEAGTRMQMSPIGGRAPGRINLNTIWDIETFQALCDAQPVNFFTDAQVNTMFAQMMKSRTPSGIPGSRLAQADRPFLPGASLEDTVYRADPDNAGKRLFEVALAAPNSHPALRFELLHKIASNVTTRSNVFAVWLTVGFFEVVDDSDATRPPMLGKEIGRAEGRHVRHRMFAVVDRSNLSVAYDPATMLPTVGTAGPLPYYIEAQSGVLAPGEVTVSVASQGGSYEDTSWGIGVGSKLVVDVGANQEIVTVSARSFNADTAKLSFTATYTKPHPPGFAISNAVLGHPGPQPNFDARGSSYAGVVRYFSIIE
ncbi:MAG: hypothetical protein K2R98_07305 [Gemmataceae bacterium]|nr:hypothetical protein [Gemmataceae bacterium]